MIDVADGEAIKALLHSQFAALNWGSGKEADWSRFQAAFASGARLWPAARPVIARSVDWFVCRMKGLAESGSLASFRERPLGIRVLGFGNIAVALAGCEMLENGSTATRDVNAVLLVKDAGGWRIGAQAWDAETANLPLPAAILLTERFRSG